MSRGCSLIEALEERKLLSFGLTTTSSSYTVDTGAQIVFSVSRTAGSGSAGDLTSILYNGVQLEAPFSSTSRFSHYESGLSSSCVVSAAVDPNGNWIKIACDDTGGSGVGVIQYYMALKGSNDIYMATYAAGPASPSPGEMRFITYLNWNIFTGHPTPSDISNDLTGTTQTAIESSDVFGDPSNGQTHSKYYGEMRSIDGLDYGATGSSGGNNYGAFMFIGNRESSSGGPFFKDIDFQSTGASVELYNYMFSGHSQTENFRPGLQGPYALSFTNGSAPVAPDYSFIAGLGLSGYVAASARGTLTGKASGVPAGQQVTVALSNATAQYWATPDSSGNYIISGAKPGTYVETLYDNELAVGTLGAVTISAGATTAQNITDTYFIPSASNTIWRIGTWDGTPIGLLNANLIGDMHPSDARMSPWADDTGVSDYTVGTTPDSEFPMAEWKYQNSAAPYTDTDDHITFTLTAAQASTAMTLRIGLTRANGDGGAGRPIISVNGGKFSNAPAASTQPDSRGVTTGNWRGNNITYTYTLSTSSVHSGSNTIDIEIASGNTNTGDAWLGPWVIFDAIDLVTTSSLANQPAVKTVAVSPVNPSVFIGTQQAFTAAATDQFGNPIAANFSWTSTRGAVDGTGLYIAPGTPGSDGVTATSGTIAGSASVNVTTLTVIQGTNGSDAIVLTRDSANSANLDVYVNSSSPTYSVPFAELSALSIAGLNGNDTITLDYSNGSPIPAGAISIGEGSGAALLDLQGVATGDTITLTSGSFTFSAANAAADSLTVDSTASIILNAQQRLNNLNISGGRVAVSPNGTSPLVLHSLSITGGSFDLANNGMIIDYTGNSPIATIRSYLTRGFNGGAWNGAGIVSSSAASDGTLSHAIGYAEASDLGGMSFMGQAVDSTAVLLRYTRYGDNNLDGAVDIGNDFDLFLDSLAASGSSWFQGDYTYDNKVDLGNDFNLFIRSYLGIAKPQAAEEGNAIAPSKSSTVQLAAAPVFSTAVIDSSFSDSTSLDHDGDGLFA